MSYIEELSHAVECIARLLVRQQEAVSVTSESEGASVSIILAVASEDVGLILGKNGHTIRALRTVLIAANHASGNKVSLEVRDRRGE